MVCAWSVCADARVARPGAALCVQMLGWRDLVVRVAEQGEDGVAALRSKLQELRSPEQKSAAADGLDAALCVDGVGAVLVAYACDPEVGACTVEGLAHDWGPSLLPMLTILRWERARLGG